MRSNMNFLSKSVYALPKASLQQSLEAMDVKQLLNHAIFHNGFDFMFSFAR